jgi:lycopene cyclase domain-containing protein
VERLSPNETHVEKYTYLFLMLLSLSYPLAQSFESRVQYYRYWPGVFLGTAVMMLLFIPWDVWFTYKGAWGFNEWYITGITIGNLPVEEWLFFIIVPFACAFIYEVLNYFVPQNVLAPLQHRITAALILISFVLSVVYVDRIYTFTTFSLLTLFLVWHLLVKKSPWIGRFYLAFLIIQIPFLLINGALTGVFTEQPVVWYSPTAIVGPRIITIPAEDIGYNLLMLLIVITVLENYKSRVLGKALSVT